MTVSSHIAHNTYASGIRKYGEILTGDIFDRVIFQFLPENPVCFPKKIQFAFCDGADDPNGKSGTGEGLAINKF